MDRRGEERIIFNNWDYDAEAEEAAAIDYLDENGMEINEENVIQAVMDNLDLWWEDEERNIEEHFKQFEYGFLVIANITRWGGEQRISKFMRDWPEIRRECISVYNAIRLYDLDRNFFIEGIHHDGRDRFEVKALTREGWMYLRQWRNCFGENVKSADIFAEELANSNRYTDIIDFANTIYGE